MARSLLVLLTCVLLAGTAGGQIEEICAEQGITPGLDSPFAHVPYVYGRVVLKGFDPGKKPPKVVVSLVDGPRSAERWTLDKSGNYCFKRKTNGGEILVEVDGTEAARRPLAAYGSQQREDFEVYPNQSQRTTPPGVVSAKFHYPKNEKTVELYYKVLDAEDAKKTQKAIDILKEIVAIDPADFIAWAKLGSLYFKQDKLAGAEAAFRKSLELRVDYTPAWVNVGQIRVAQKQFEAAVEIFKYTVELEPTSAATYRLLGEAYLQARQGTLGAQALNEAIRLDPIGMAECHLLLAHLYELAGAKQMATREYKAFLAKVPEFADRARLEKFIKENPE